MPPNPLRRRPWVWLLLSVALTCAVPAGAADDTRRHLDEARAALAAGDPLGASSAYERAAGGGTPLADEYRLLAAETAVQAGDSVRALRLLDGLRPGRLDPAQTLRRRLVIARAALVDGQPHAALQQLPNGAGPVAALAPEVLAVRGAAQFMAGDPVSATATLVRREALLGSDAAAIADNREQLWSGLSALPLSAADRGRFASLDVVSRGWLELAWALQQTQGDALGRWRAQYPRHPAGGAWAAVRRDQLAQQGGLAGDLAGGGWAVLLPLSGPLAPSGEAVRDGLLWSYFAAPEPRPTLRFYDTAGDVQRAQQVYRQAVGEGAALVIGPLSKPEIAAIVDGGLTPTPLLALNHLDALTAAGAVTQMALAPEDEAAMAAAQAADAGLRRAALLMPSGDWGERVANAFVARFEALGGEVREIQRYAPRTADLAEPIRDLLNLSESEARNRALAGVLGEQPQFEPHRRQDIDMLFVGASASDARVILPQLRFHRADGLPVYATSLVRSVGDMDVGTVRFCDMPWVIDELGYWAQQRRAAETAFDAARWQSRLFAFGVDAWQVAQRWQQGSLWDATHIDGATGRLMLDDGGAMRRELDCVELRGGGLRPLPRVPQTPALRFGD